MKKEESGLEKGVKIAGASMGLPALCGLVGFLAGGPLGAVFGGLVGFGAGVNYVEKNYPSERGGSSETCNCQNGHYSCPIHGDCRDSGGD